MDPDLEELAALYLPVQEPVRLPYVETEGSIESFMPKAPPTPIRPPMVTLAPVSQEVVCPLLTLGQQLQQHASEIGVSNVFVDGGYHAAVLCAMFGLTPLPGKRGDDASRDGRTYELKAVNLLDGNGALRTRPALNAGSRIQENTLKRWETQTDAWVIGYFTGVSPQEVWQLPCVALKPLVDEWRQELQTQPQGGVLHTMLSYNFVREHGHQIFPAVSV